MIIQVLGSGCPNCVKLENNAKEAAKVLNLDDVKIEHVTEIGKIVEYGVMSTPALIINDVVKSTGRIPDVEEIKTWLNA